MKIEKLRQFKTIRDGIGDDDFCERITDKINELIDAHNDKQPKDMTFEEALVHFKAGKKIKRMFWLPNAYLSQERDENLSSDDMLSDDWRVME